MRHVVPSFILYAAACGQLPAALIAGNAGQNLQQGSREARQQAAPQRTVARVAPQRGMVILTEPVSRFTATLLAPLCTTPGMIAGLAALPFALLQAAQPVQVTPDLPTPRPAALAPSAQNKPMVGEITPELDLAVRKGLAVLAEMQNEDGSFGGGRFNRNVAVTALGGLAFMGDGHLPGRGQYGPNVEKALNNVLGMATEIGLITGDAGNGPMYGHGFATLFLGEVHGMTGGDDDSPLAKRTHEALIRACRLIERTQNAEGGWRYNPVPNDADVSVTICQIMALRSARNAGIEVPKATIDKAVEYVRKCQNQDGGFMYQLPSGVSAWPRSAAGVASLYYAGIYEDTALDKGVAYLLKEAMPENRTRSETHYWYGLYYTAQSMYLAGGPAWESFWTQSRRELLRSQASGGFWNDPGIGQAYGTSMALIVLQMPKRYLPIFQK